MKKEKLNCFLSIPKKFNPDKLVQALQKQGINIEVHNSFDFKEEELVKADLVVALLKYRSMSGYGVAGIAAREKKKLLVIQNADYREHYFLDRKGVARCIIPHHKIAEIEKEVLTFIKTKRIKPLRTV